MLNPSRSSDELYAEIGKRISKARLDFGMTQEQLGKQLSLSRTSITNIEGGRQKILVHILLEIADVLEVKVGDLLPQPPSKRDSTVSSELLEPYSDEVRKFVKGVE